MIILKIDGRQVEIDQSANPAITVAIADIKEPENSSTGYSKSVDIPFTPTNLSIFGYTNELYCKDRFNNQHHTAEYQNDDTVVMRGTAQIEKITYNTGCNGQITGGVFSVSVIGAAYEWICAAKKRVNEVESDDAVKYTFSDIYANSVQTTPSLIKFFPVDRGAFWEQIAEGMIPRKGLDIKDYHPFINVWRLMKLIFNGWSLRSSNSRMLERLYCSGYMPLSEDMSYIKEENDFKCGTTQEDTTINLQGLALWSMNLFDKWTNLPGEDGGYFTATSGILSVVSGQFYTIFKPTASTTVAFNIALAYTSKIGKQGQFIDTFSCGSSVSPIQLTLKDSTYECFSNLTSDPSYGGDYLIFLKLKNPNDFEGIYSVWTWRDDNDYEYEQYTKYADIEIAGQYFLLRPLTDLNYRNCIKRKDGTEIRLDNGTEMERFEAVQVPEDEISFVVTKQTNIFSIQQGESFSLSTTFSTSNKKGINQSNSLRITLGKCEMTPEFKNGIGQGDKVNIATIGGTATQLEFLAAIRQMFNLMFYTNPQTKEVVISPRKSFYNLNRADLLDWRDKIDYSKEIVVEDLGGDFGSEFKLAYADGNEVVKRYNWKGRTELGAWQTPLLNKSSNELKEVVNPMFAPFISRAIESVGMTIPQNKSEKTQELIKDVDLDITPIIGYFDGVTIRKSGNDRLLRPKYPNLVFQDATRGLNLGFGDLNTTPALPGLNQYYADNISVYNHGRRLTLYLKLAAQDIEDMQFPTDQMRDLRAIFLLRLDGEDVPCVLESISDYNPRNGSSTKCQFVVDANIKLTGGERVVIKRGEVVVLRDGAVMVKPGL